MNDSTEIVRIYSKTIKRSVYQAYLGQKLIEMNKHGFLTLITLSFTEDRNYCIGMNDLSV